MTGKRIRKRIVSGSILLIITILFSACSNGEEEISEAPESPTMTEEEAGTERYKEFYNATKEWSIMATDLWEKDPSLHEESDLSLYNEAYQSYLITLSDEKETFSKDMDMDRYSELIKAAAMKDLDSATASMSESVEVQGLEGVKYQVQGQIDEVSVTYLFLILENEEEFTQVILWSFTQNIENNRSYYENLLESIKHHEVEHED